MVLVVAAPGSGPRREGGGLGGARGTEQGPAGRGSGAAAVAAAASA